MSKHAETLKNCVVDIDGYYISVRVTKYSADITKDTPYWVTLEKKNPLSSTDIRMTTKFHTSEEAGMQYAFYIENEVAPFRLEEIAFAEINLMGIEYPENQLGKDEIIGIEKFKDNPQTGDDV